MALTVANASNPNSTTSGATLAANGTAAKGTLLILAVAADNAGTSGVPSITTVSDLSGNTWTNLARVNQTSGAASDGTTLDIWVALVHNPLVSGSGTVTINFSPNTTAKCATLQKVTPGAGKTIEVVAVGAGVHGNGTAWEIGPVSVTDGDTIFGVRSAETTASTAADSDTTNGSWSSVYSAAANTGTTTSSQALATQYKTVTATGDQTFGVTAGAARDFAVNYLILREVAGTDLAVTEPRDTFAAALAPGWPSALPVPTLQGYGLQPAAAVERQAMEIGAPRVYRRTKRPPIDVSVQWQLNEDEQALLDGFQRSILQEGAQWFGIELLFPSGLSKAVARFKGTLAMRARGGPRWQTTATLELLTRPVMSDADLTVLLDDDGDPPAWPTDLLPYPTLDSWELTPKPATIRTEDSLPGYPSARQRSLNSTTEVPAAWELSATEAAIFDGFFRWRGLDGAQWFDFPLIQAIGEDTTKVRFTGEADWTPRGSGRWAVSAPLEVRERTVMTAAQVIAEMGS